ncbi:hypothetical protein SMACR_06502 [Sordaria macrospora]|uniref:WGS project CABT00000000 data, contig 2.13 n=2 Tax=Sordaria macrospora TaxID=5147 RepID=F7VYG1_SORMK|nr:uncharacterized protein SMAC_06502 [Sordaria macrospora k-hell]KAA8629306.1 hypothetical protein SMACR_06502 [Sordaria macrospora]WPJ62996.1 hypothetical protein SMAC4_06502 [Sordaria macrospora]CCC10555.1 unnamed protein product [Sordaria macrospora k-hell]
MSCPRPPPLDLTHLPPTPPATPDKQQQHPLTSTSPSTASWTPLKPKSVRFALPAPQAHKSKTLYHTSSIFNADYLRRKPKPKAKRIPTRPYNASLNRLTERYYVFVQSLCDPELSSPRFDVVDNKLVSESNRGILAPPPSPMSLISPVRGIEAQIQQRKALQVIRDDAHALVYKPLTAIAPVLTLPFLPSQQAAKKVRGLLKRAKRALMALEALLTSEVSDSDSDEKMEMGMDVNRDRELANVESGNRMDLDHQGGFSENNGKGEEGNGGDPGRCGDNESLMVRELSQPRASGRKAPEGLPNAGLCTFTYREDFEEEAHHDIARSEEQAQDEAALTSLGGFMGI